MAGAFTLLGARTSQMGHGGGSVHGGGSMHGGGNVHSGGSVHVQEEDGGGGRPGLEGQLSCDL